MNSLFVCSHRLFVLRFSLISSSSATLTLSLLLPPHILTLSLSSSNVFSASSSYVNPSKIVNVLVPSMKQHAYFKSPPIVFCVPSLNRCVYVCCVCTPISDLMFLVSRKTPFLIISPFWLCLFQVPHLSVYILLLFHSVTCWTRLAPKMLC